MKATIKTKTNRKALTIPPELLNSTGLNAEDDIDAYGCGGAILLLGKQMTPMQLVDAIDMLHSITGGLILQLEAAAGAYADSCRQISIPQEILDKAGIYEGAPLEILYDEGELYISVVPEEDDPVERLPGYLYDLLLEIDNMDHSALRFFLNSEEAVDE